MKKLLETDKPSEEALEQMRVRGGRWAAYQNVALDSANLGLLQFLKVGPGCTYKEPPKRMPDTRTDLGWKYAFVGWVNIETGEIESKGGSDGEADEGAGA